MVYTVEATVASPEDVVQPHALHAATTTPAMLVTKDFRVVLFFSELGSAAARGA